MLSNSPLCDASPTLTVSRRAGGHTQGVEQKERAAPDPQDRAAFIWLLYHGVGGLLGVMGLRRMKQRGDDPSWGTGTRVTTLKGPQKRGVEKKGVKTGSEERLQTGLFVRAFDLLSESDGGEKSRQWENEGQMAIQHCRV